MPEPVTLADIKTHLRLEADATGEDTYLSALLLGARRACELRTNLSIVGTSASVTLDTFPARHVGLIPTWSIEVEQPDILYIDLPGGTVASITAVTYRDGAGATQTIDPAEYIADLSQIPARVGPRTAWPVAGDGPGAVWISYVTSPLSPEDTAAIAHAIRLLVGNWYSNREGAVVDTRGVPTELPLAVTWLLEPLRQFATS